MLASQHIDEPAVLTTEREYVSGVVSYSDVASIPSRDIAPVHVVAVSDIHADKAAVFDLTIDAIPEFFANGVLVHNSMDCVRYMTMGLERGGGKADIAGAEKESMWTEGRGGRSRWRR